MHHIANQGLLNKVPINYSNYPLVVYTLSHPNLQVEQLVDYLNLDLIDITIDQQLIRKYAGSNNNAEVTAKIDYLFREAVLNNYNIAIIGTDECLKLKEQISELRNAYYFIIVYFLGVNKNVAENIKNYKEYFSMCHEFHYLYLLDDQFLQLLFSKYGRNVCYYQNNLD